MEGRDGERWWGRVPAVATVRQEPMRAALPWGPVLARLCAAAATGALAAPVGDAMPPPNHEAQS
jgi:hypothetical protein